LNRAKCNTDIRVTYPLTVNVGYGMDSSVRTKEGGTLRSEGHYEQGVETGIWSDYLEDGKLAARGEYVQGKSMMTGDFSISMEMKSVVRSISTEKILASTLVKSIRFAHPTGKSLGPSPAFF
jgi:hypothetical protein